MVGQHVANSYRTKCAHVYIRQSAHNLKSFEGIEFEMIYDMNDMQKCWVVNI